MRPSRRIADWVAPIGDPSLCRAGAAAMFMLIAACPSAHGASRDWRTWPFSQTSPWNMPIGDRALYAPVPHLDHLHAGLNFADRWTSAVVLSTSDDPLVHVRVNTSWPTTNWAFLAHPRPNCDNTPQDEAMIQSWLDTPGRAAAANPWSTISPDSHAVALPASYHRADQDFRAQVRLHGGACPSPDTDGLMANFQPDGWVLDTYATVILRNGDVVSDRLASFIDARADGTGWWNGRRASMLPSFAGLIRDGEIASGRIPHALALVMTSHLLARRAVWPAAAFDRDSKSYTGTLAMGALLAIPASVDLERLGLTATGKIIARAAQDYGGYIVDSTDGDGVTINAELNDPEIRWQDWQRDIDLIAHQLQQVTNNARVTPGGGGTPRAGLAPVFAEP